MSELAQCPKCGGPRRDTGGKALEYQHRDGCTKASSLLSVYTTPTPARSEAAGGEERIEPCPFCGDLPRVTEYEGNDHVSVDCVNQDCHINPETSVTTRAKAIRVWNARAILRSEPETGEAHAVDWDNAEQAERALMALYDCVTNSPNATPEATTAVQALPGLLARKNGPAVTQHAAAHAERIPLPSDPWAPADWRRAIAEARRRMETGSGVRESWSDPLVYGMLEKVEAMFGGATVAGAGATGPLMAAIVAERRARRGHPEIMHCKNATNREIRKLDEYIAGIGRAAGQANEWAADLNLKWQKKWAAAMDQSGANALRAGEAEREATSLRQQLANMAERNATQAETIAAMGSKLGELGVTWGDLEATVHTMDDLRQQLAAAREDGERLDWMESQRRVRVGFVSARSKLVWHDSDGSLRAAIDRARTEPAREGEGGNG